MLNLRGCFSSLLGVLLIFGAAGEELNNSPIIGIFSQPSTSTDGNCDGDCVYIAASYVKYLESAGARVVPINYYSSDAEIDELLPNLNGVLFPGGASPYPAAAQHTFDKIVEMNDAGDFMPLWGTCMGFQWLLISAARDTSILDPSDGSVLDSYNVSLPLDFTPAAMGSKLFADASVHMMEMLAKENVTMNNHHYGMFPQHFESIDALSSFYNLLSTNEDQQGVEFISTIEAYKYPIFGSQWHPEKNNFEWGKTSDGIPIEAINHSSDAVSISQYTSTFFVDQARHSLHRFATESDEAAALIWNYPVTDTRDSSTSFVQEYFFHF